MLKKLVSLLLSVVLLSILSFSFVFANDFKNTNSSDKKVILVEHEEINNLNTLIKRAKAGITDIKFNGNPEWVFKDLNTGNIKQFKAMNTTQLLSEYKIGSNIYKTYKTTLIYAPEYDGSDYRTKWDPSISVEAYSNIYWNSYTSDVTGNELHGLSAVSGGWYETDPTVSASDRKVYIAQDGFNYDEKAIGYTKWFYPTSDSYYYSLESYGWEPVDITQTYYGYGSTSFITLHRGTRDVWQLYLTNGECVGVSLYPTT